MSKAASFALGKLLSDSVHFECNGGDDDENFISPHSPIA